MEVRRRRGRALGQSTERASEVEARLAGNWKYGLRTYTIEHAALTVAEQGKTEVLSESTCGKLILFKFQYATDGIFRSNPAAHPFYGMLEGPPVSALEVGCAGRLHTFLLRADGTLLAFRDLHERDPAVEILTR